MERPEILARLAAVKAEVTAANIDIIRSLIDLFGRSLEFTKSLADGPADLGEPFGAENEQSDDEDKDKFLCPDASEHSRSILVSCLDLVNPP